MRDDTLSDSLLNSTIPPFRAYTFRSYNDSVAEFSSCDGTNKGGLFGKADGQNGYMSEAYLNDGGLRLAEHGRAIRPLQCTPASPGLPPPPPDIKAPLAERRG